MIQSRLPECCARCLERETTKSWRISSQTRDRFKDDNRVELLTTYWIDVPLCASCHRKLRAISCLFLVAGLMAGLVACGLLVQYVSPSEHLNLGDDTLSICLSLGMLLLVVAIPACSIAWVLNLVFVESPLANYNPLTGRLSFGNKHYQELYDQANQFLNTSRSRLGI
jgi:hypothetical protein